MSLVVCFDALGTLFSPDPLVEAVDALLGDRLRAAGSGARSTVMDWFHSAQRDYTYLSIIAPPPPPIAQILKLTLPRSLHFALSLPSSLSASADQLPDLSPIYERLTALTPSPGCMGGIQYLKSSRATVLIITNGSKATTEGYVARAGLESSVDGVKSCDEVGLGKPLKGVYQAAVEFCGEVAGKGARVAGGPGGPGGPGGEAKMSKWFVASHMWDLAAARKAGFKIGAVLSEQPPLGSQADGKDGESSWWELWGGEPDVVGLDLEEVAKGIVAWEGRHPTV